MSLPSSWRLVHLPGLAAVVPVVLLVVLPVVLLGLASGCAHVDYRAAFSSEVRHEALPLRATVTVLIDPALRQAWDEDDARLEYLRETLSDALKRDLTRNGPLTPVAVDPDARLEVVIREAHDSDRKYYFMMWFFAPVWLFGVPYHGLALDLVADVRLYPASGGTAFESKLSASCTQLEGLYYGRDDLTFGCAAKQLSEDLRERISMRRAAILARVGPTRAERAIRPTRGDGATSAQAARDGPASDGPASERSLEADATARANGSEGVNTSLVAASPASLTSSRASGERPIAVVFLIRDMSGRFQEPVMEQLTEYLAAQVTERLAFRVVPRALVRDALATSKAESYRACFDDACQIELGQALAANKSLSTTLIQIGQRCVLNATVYDLRTEAAEQAASAETNCDEGALIDGVRDVVAKLGAR
ncbi:MAG: hypothetical protein H6729_09295 [Deltaproteobacteria bacterium]|nr:hypothetical protein [Deltaproteobacteria bacterium]